jgi:hypothetical protein
MTEPDFWKIINQGATRSGSDWELSLEFVSSSLEVLPKDELASFARHFETARDQLICQRFYAVCFIVEGSDHDEDALDFAAWVILMGEAVYRRALENLDSLADVLVVDVDDYSVYGEQFAFLPYQIHEEAYGEELEFLTGRHVREDAFEEQMDFGDEERMMQLFPRIFEKLGGYHEDCFESEEEEGEDSAALGKMFATDDERKAYFEFLEHLEKNKSLDDTDRKPRIEN